MDARVIVVIFVLVVSGYSSVRDQHTAALSEAGTTLPESSSRPLLAKTAHSRNLAHASLETAVSILRRPLISDGFEDFYPQLLVLLWSVIGVPLPIQMWTS